MCDYKHKHFTLLLLLYLSINLYLYLRLCAGCDSRFTHANRHCAQHPSAGLRREDSSTAILQLITEDTRPDVAQWLRR
jgi:CRISPR/Cas system-associated protein endoribonuclease Cas2